MAAIKVALCIWNKWRNTRISVTAAEGMERVGRRVRIGGVRHRASPKPGSLAPRLPASPLSQCQTPLFQGKIRPM